MEIIDNETHLWDMITKGIEAEKFFKTKLGQYILQRSQEEIEEYWTTFLNTNLIDIQQARTLQLRAQAAQLAIMWLNETIREGIQAQARLDHRIEEVDF